jgi:hypothetical protein
MTRDKMSVETKTTKELTEQFLANFEAVLNQDSPLNDKAFLRVMSAILAMFGVSIIKLTQGKALENLILTSFGSKLDEFGVELDLPRKQAQSAVLDIALPAEDGTVVPATAVFVGDSNGERYLPDSSSPPASGGAALLTVTAETPGVAGNLNDGETMTINVNVPGAETVATVLATDTFGVEEEEDAPYQQRLLTKSRKKSGGYNFSDNRIWAEETPGVARAYPFTGIPGDPLSKPPERTIFIKADPDIDPDGIAPPALLDSAREYLTVDPVTGQSRLTLGMTDELLYVLSITIKLIYVEVRGLVTPSGQEAEVKAAIESALAAFFLGLEPFVEGLDVEEERRDLITDPIISKVVQDVLQATGSSAIGVGFGFAPGSFEPQYRLLPGELTQLGLPVAYG